MRTFEEEASKEFKKTDAYVRVLLEDTDVSDEKGLIVTNPRDIENRNYVFPWLEFAKDWMSPEDVQNLKNKIHHLEIKLGQRVIYLPHQVISVINDIDRQKSVYQAINLIMDWKSWKTFGFKDNKNWAYTHKWMNELPNHRQDLFAKAWIYRNFKVDRKFRLKNGDFYIYELDMENQTFGINDVYTLQKSKAKQFNVEDEGNIKLGNLTIDWIDDNEDGDVD